MFGPFSGWFVFLFPVVNGAEGGKTHPLKNVFFYQEIPKLESNPLLLMLLNYVSKLNKVKLDKKRELRPAGCFNKQTWALTVNKSFPLCQPGCLLP